MQNLIKSRVADESQPISAICHALLAQIKALPVKDEFRSGRLNELAEDLIYYTDVSERIYRRPEVELLDELERTIFTLKSFGHIELEGPKRMTIDLLRDCFIGCMVQNGLYEYISHKLRTCASSLPSTAKLLGYALKPSTSSKRGSTFYPAMVQLLINTSRDDRSSLWSKMELPSLWANFLIPIPVTWGQISEDAKLAQLEIIKMLLNIGADPNQRHNGDILWIKTLEEVCRTRLDRKEDIEMIDRYRYVFTSSDVDP
jgi:hypothetical protein